MGRLPEKLQALVCDFDGVFTDNRVLVSEHGDEFVFCDRGDGMGIELLRETGLPILVLSRERNKVVKVRCDKMKIPCIHGVLEKEKLLGQWLSENDMEAENIIYIGNDINDIGCLKMAGCAVVVADAHPDVLPFADIVLRCAGGKGAIRELCDMLCKRLAACNGGGS